MKRLICLTALTLTLAACNSTPTPVIEPAPVQTISGTASAAAGVSLTLVASDGEALGSAVTVAADGSFSVSLPTPEAARLKTVTTALAGLPCDVLTTVTASDPLAVGLGISSAKSGSVTLIPATVQRSLFGRHVELHAWVYSDRATTLSGQLDCARATGGAVSTLPVSINASLVRGWTPVVAKIDASLGLGGLTGSGTISNASDYRGTWITPQDLQKQAGL